jgi:hypothetical protein
VTPSGAMAGSAPSGRPPRAGSTIAGGISDRVAK